MRRLGISPAEVDVDDRRQPAPSDPLLVLAARVPVLPARRRPLPCAQGRAQRARNLRQRALRVRASLGLFSGSAGARGDGTDDQARVARGGSLPAPDRRRPRRDRAGSRRADPRAGPPTASREHVPQGRPAPGVRLRARRRRGGASRRRHPLCTGRRRTDPMAPRVAGRSRPGDAAARDRLQGRHRQGARAPRCGGGRVKRLLLLLLMAALAGCGGDDGDGGGAEAQESECVTQGSAQLPELEEGKTYRLAFKTNQGDFTIELDREQAPCTSASFVSLTEKGFFNGLTFHRIVPGFVIQGGDPKGDGSGGPGYQTVDEPPQDARYTKGVVAMAKTIS